MTAMTFQAQMNLSNLNTRPEKAGKEVGDGAADLTLTGKVHINALKPLMTEHALAILDHMYDDNGNFQCQDFEPFVLTREFEKCRAKLATPISKQEIVFGIVKFNQFKVALEVNRTAVLTARVQCHPEPDQVAELFKLMARDVDVIVEELQAALPLESKKDEQKGLDLGGKSDKKTRAQAAH